jgi:hypothetical protein
VIPLLYVDAATEELNAILASHRIVQIERHLIDQGSQSAFAFCVEYTLSEPTVQRNGHGIVPCSCFKIVGPQNTSKIEFIK